MCGLFIWRTSLLTDYKDGVGDATIVEVVDDYSEFILKLSIYLRVRKRINV